MSSVFSLFLTQICHTASEDLEYNLQRIWTTFVLLFKLFDCLIMYDYYCLDFDDISEGTSSYISQKIKSHMGLEQNKWWKFSFL